MIAGLTAANDVYGGNPVSYAQVCFKDQTRRLTGLFPTRVISVDAVVDREPKQLLATAHLLWHTHGTGKQWPDDPDSSSAAAYVPIPRKNETFSTASVERLCIPYSPARV
jgi:hypothetical protein